MIESAQNTQFTLTDKGDILFQKNPTNPVPGVVVGRAVKGQAELSPVAEVIEEALPEGEDKAAIGARLNAWLETHVRSVLEPLFPLNDETRLDGAARGIAFQLYEALGIVPRQQLEDLISDLDEEGRNALRKCRVRMGPVLVFLPELNKPAAIRLRALLWLLWRDRPLPADVPKDGMTSIAIDPKTVDRAYYSAIGYPVYGSRAIRVDMLDRLVCQIYDSAEGGKFQAQHKMAEWLGCTIDDLYSVLQSMGHVKIHDPADDKEKQEDKKEDVSVVEAKDAEKSEEEEKKPEVKPELATFHLKSGKAYGRKSKPEQQKKRPPKKQKQKGKPRQKEPKVIKSGPAKRNPDDSPFAVLKQLKENKGK